MQFSHHLRLLARSKRRDLTEKIFHLPTGPRHDYSPSTRFAFARIFAAEAELSFPRFTICVARALAFAAWLLSGIGYFREPGRPNSLLGIDLRSAVSSFAILAPCRENPGLRYRLFFFTLWFSNPYRQCSQSIGWMAGIIMEWFSSGYSKIGRRAPLIAPKIL